MSDKQGDMMINRDFDMNKFGGETTYSIGLKEEAELDEERGTQKRLHKNVTLKVDVKTLPLGKEGDNADKMYTSLVMMSCLMTCMLLVRKTQREMQDQLLNNQ